MGQKVRPTGYRVGIMEDWRSRWYASKHEFADLLVEDFKIRAFIKKKYGFAGIPKIEIERTRDAVTVLLSTARPGVIIGRKGAEVEVLQKDLQELTGRRIEIKIVEVCAARNRRTIDQRGHRRAAPEAVELPTDDETRNRADHGRRRQGRQDPACGPLGRHRDVANRGAGCRLGPPLDAQG